MDYNNFAYEDGTWRYVVFHSLISYIKAPLRWSSQSLDKALISADLDGWLHTYLSLSPPKSATTLSFVKGFSSSMDNQTPDRVAVVIELLPGDDDAQLR